MNKKNYIESFDHLNISSDFKERTEKIMKKNQTNNEKSSLMTKKLVLTFASAAIIISAGTFALNYNNLFPSKDITNENNTNSILMTETAPEGITVPITELPKEEESAVQSNMMGLFVYQGSIYLQSNTYFSTDENFMIQKEDILNLRGNYLGKTKGNITEWSKQEDYAKEFASTIGESDIYAVKGYDSKHRLMVYSEYEGGYSCEIYDSFGGHLLKTGADYFNFLNLKDNIVSYQWESYDSWNNGKGERVDEKANDDLNQFINALYTSTPMGNDIDMFTKNTQNDSQKFAYVKTKDNLITSLRLFKEGYVFAPEVGFFKIEQDAFETFWNTMPVTAGIDVEAPIDTSLDASMVDVTIGNTSYTVDTDSITLNIKNNGLEEIFYGVDYSIEKLSGDTWEVVPAVKDLMFIEIAKIQEANSKEEFKIDLSQLNPKLDAGHYRIVKNINGKQFNVEFDLTK